MSAGELTYTNLCNNEICTLKCYVKVVCENCFAVDSCSLEHTDTEVADNVSLAVINIHKGDFLELE